MQGSLSAKKRQGDFIPSSSGAPYQQDNKRSKYAPVDPPPSTLHSVVDYIFGLPSLENVEVEFRVGKLSADGRRFVSSIHEEDFKAVYSSIKKDCKFSCETDYIYDHGHGRNARLSVSEGTLVSKGCYKERLGAFDMGTNLPFDIRIGIAKETPLTPLPVVIEQNYTKKRTKTRFTLDSKDWKIDLTDVTTGDEEKSFELEVEVKMASIMNCSDHRACISLLSSVFAEIHTILSKIQSTTAAQLFPDLKLERIINQSHRSFLKREFVQLFPGVNNPDRFPGSLPSGLERGKIKMLQTNKYWVSEKSDGLRLMLFCIGTNVFLVDRKMDFFLIHKFSLLVDLFGRTGVSLIDGEMVRHLRTGKLMFLMFDILALNGRIGLGAYTLLDRLNIITKQVVEPFRNACKACNMKDDSSRLPFALAGKAFRFKSGIKQLVEFIKQQEGGERLFIDDKRCHKNDGLIFTLDGPYLCHSSSHLMKWKYCDRLTIDFRFKLLPDDRFTVLVGTGRNKEEEMVGFQILPEHWDRLKSDMARNINPREAIIECAYDAKRQQWEYLNLRPDKNMANHINTMKHTMDIVTENITLEELVYRVPIADPSYDEWEKTHPELYKQSYSYDQPTPSSSENTPSPGVDLPSTPIDSPIAYVPSPSPSPGLSSPSPSKSTTKPAATTAVPTYKPSSQLRRHQAAAAAAATAPLPVGFEGTECTDTTRAFFNTPLASFSTSPDGSDVPQFDSAFDSLPPIPIPNFDTDSSFLSLSPPTSPSAFFS